MGAETIEGEASTPMPTETKKKVRAPSARKKKADLNPADGVTPPKEPETHPPAPQVPQPSEFEAWVSRWAERATFIAQKLAISYAFGTTVVIPNPEDAKEQEKFVRELFNTTYHILLQEALAIEQRTREGIARRQRSADDVKLAFETLSPFTKLIEDIVGGPKKNAEQLEIPKLDIQEYMKRRAEMEAGGRGGAPPESPATFTFSFTPHAFAPSSGDTKSCIICGMASNHEWHHFVSTT